MLRYLKLFVIVFVAMLLFNVQAIAQADSTSILPKIEVPEGFNWFYLGFFILGMLLHYAYKVYKVVGTINYFKSLLNNFVGWFLNKFHRTLLAGFVVSILALVQTLGLQIDFSSITLLGGLVATAAGFIGDMANAGEIK
jgi:hypothetical protein